MPMTLYTESGEEKEVLTDEEVNALKAPGALLQELLQGYHQQDLPLQN